MTHDDEHRPTLTVIEGGEVSEVVERRGKRTALNEHGLTAQQEAFAQGLANGLSNAEAYRRAGYAPTAKPATVHEHACRLAATEKVKARVNNLAKAKLAAAQYAGAKVSDRILALCWRIAESDAEKGAAKVAALTLAAKMHGLLVERVEKKDVTEKPADIDAELREALERYSKAL